LLDSANRETLAERKTLAEHNATHRTETGNKSRKKTMMDYPLEPWLLTPLPTANTRAQVAYNATHMKTRNIIERCFGVLKSEVWKLYCK